MIPCDVFLDPFRETLLANENCASVFFEENEIAVAVNSDRYVKMFTRFVPTTK